MPSKSIAHIPATMQVARAHAPGREPLQIAEHPTPTPAPGQILIRVESAAVNFSDLKRVRGDLYPFPTSFPFVPGSEVAGIVVAHGPGVEGPAIGTPVFALAGNGGEGGFAQFAVAWATTAIPIPPGLATDTAAVLLVAGSTAALLLTQAARLAAGERILIPAATGGVGSFAVGLARRMGAGQIIAAVGGEAKFARARALGADAVVDYERPDWAERVLALSDGEGVDVALEAAGGGTLEQTLACLAPFGRAVVFGAASGRSATLSPAAIDRLLYAPALNQAIVAFNLGTWFMQRPDIAAAALTEVLGGILSDELAVPEISTLPLSEANTALQRLEQRLSSGKLVLHPWS